MDLINLFLVVSASCLAGYAYIHIKYRYWTRNGIPNVKPHFPYGNIKGIFQEQHGAFMLQKLYQQMKGQGPFMGIFFLMRRAVLALDLEFIKKMLMKDFHYFEDRGMYYNERDDPISAHLFALDGGPWKKLRSKLTPTFTSGKMKFMFPTVVDVADKFKNKLEELIQDRNEVIEFRELLARYSTDIIGTCAFGIECNSLTDPESKFLKMGHKVFSKPRYHPLISFLIDCAQPFARSVRVKAVSDDVSEFFMKIVNENVAYREENHIHRNDFMDILIKLKNREKTNSDSTEEPLTMNEIAAQAFIFFVGGFETASTALSFGMYELAANPSIQQRAREEIHNVLKKHGGNLSYDAMMDMTYVEQIFKEAMRKYPPVSFLFRRSTMPYTVPEYNYVMPKGTWTWIPVYAIHHDPEYYSNPEVYDPDRFSPENIRARDPMTYLSFGHGPRNCIGERFGIMQAKVGLISLLQNFQFTIGPHTLHPIEISNTDLVLSPKGGVYLNVRKI